jgi:hypothetical protein
VLHKCHQEKEEARVSGFTLFRFVSFCFVLFHFISFYFIFVSFLFHFVSFCFISFHQEKEEARRIFRQEEELKSARWKKQKAQAAFNAGFAKVGTRSINTMAQSAKLDTQATKQYQDIAANLAYCHKHANSTVCTNSD